MTAKRPILELLVLCLGLSLMLYVSRSYADTKSTERAVYKQMLSINASLENARAQKISRLIVKYSRRYNLDPRLFTALLGVESHFQVNALNKRTLDWGIAQISDANMSLYGLSRRRMLVDAEYGIATGAKILSWFQVTYKKREPDTWACRYNIGTRNTKHLRKLCMRYMMKVWRYMR